MELDGELMSKWAVWVAGGMVVFGDDRPESGCLYSRSVEGSRDRTRCSTLCRRTPVVKWIIDPQMEIVMMEPDIRWQS